LDDGIVLVKAAIMGVVEGLTEFLPISSTGHLILAGALLNFNDERAKVFEIAIQSGAILAVIIVYWQKIRDTLVNLGNSRRAQRFVANVGHQKPFIQPRRGGERVHRGGIDHSVGGKNQSPQSAHPAY
jgi:hypothetical protein